MRPTRTLTLTVALAALALVVAGCGGPKVPPELEQSRALIDQAWQEGPQVQQLLLSLAGEHLELDLVRAKVEEALAGGAASMRVEAARIVANSGNQEMVAMLEPLLSESGALPIVAARGLARAGNPAGQSVLEENLRGSRGELQPENCAALAQLQENACVEEANEDLGQKGDENAFLRAAAAETLAQVGGERAREVLVARLKDLREEDRNVLIQALGRIGTPEDADALLRYAKFQANALEAIRALGGVGGDAALEYLRSLLEQRDQEAARVQAGIALARLGEVDAEVIGALEAGAMNEDSSLRFTVAEGLQDAPKTDQMAQILVGLAQDPEAPVRRAALRALEGHSAAYLETVYPAWEMSQDAQQGAAYEAGLAAIDRIGEIPGGKAQQTLVDALNSPNFAYGLEAALVILERERQGIAMGDEEEAQG